MLLLSLGCHILCLCPLADYRAASINFYTGLITLIHRRLTRSGCLPIISLSSITHDQTHNSEKRAAKKADNEERTMTSNDVTMLLSFS
ncbi:hypothetical protein GGS24DRAFT_243136 [Hypoxylon argillaceum]|nr:hypothetical protein GGS24DRAFT_243136 [Hypoxylon argillaceum]